MSSNETTEPKRFQGSHIGNSEGLKTRALQPIDQVRSDLKKMETEFKSVLPPHVPVERFTRIVLTAIQQTPGILDADRKSLFASCLKCAQDGLLPDGREAALVVFKTKNGPLIQYMPMVGGILKKVRNSGELSSITSQIVCKNDKFKYWVDADGEHLEHEPLLFGQRGERIGTYALAKTKDGAVYIEVMTEEQMEAVRQVSKAKDFGPWSGPFADEMRRKTAIRRLSKRLPMATDVEQVIQRDDELYEFNNKKPEAESVKTITDRLNDIDLLTADVETEVKKVETPSVPNAEVSNEKAALIFTAGKFAGSSLGEITPEDLAKYRTSLKEKQKKEGPHAERDETIALIDEFLGPDANG